MATSTLGAGLAPAGTSIAGFGTPATADAPPVPAAAAEARKIDPVTKDYALDSLDRIDGMSGTSQRVLLAMSTVRDSAVQRDLGLGAPPDRIVSTTRVELEDDVRRALSALVRDGAISIRSIDVTIAGSRVQRRVRWTDLLTGTDEVTTDG